jgi:hypothetical protein
MKIVTARSEFPQSSPLKTQRLSAELSTRMPIHYFQFRGLPELLYFSLDDKLGIRTIADRW